MVPRPYRPSGKSEPGAVPVLFLVCALAGLLVGVVEGLVAHYLISLLILFPLALGLAVGAVAGWRVAAGKIRAPAIAAVAALCGGLVGQLTVDRMEYEFFRFEAAAKIQAREPQADAEAVIQAYLVQETGNGGWVGFMQLQAQNGISLKRGGGKGLKLTGIGCYVLWGIELLLAAGVAALMASSRAREPFCEHCRRWYDLDESLAAGSPDKAVWSAVVAGIERGDSTSALAARGAATEKAASIFRLVRCSHCEAHEPLFRIQVVSGLDTKKPKDQRVYQTALRYDQAKGILEALAAERAAQVKAGGDAG